MERKDLPAPFPCFIITGPTAVGKTSLTIRLAKELNGEIINADSVQIYRGLDIGSAKPSIEERAEAPHHLVDILDPDEPFSVADFLRHAGRIAKDIISRGKTVIVSGGTGLYIKAFLNGLSPCPGRDAAIRRQLEEHRKKTGTEDFFRILEKVDPAAARRIHPNDRYRVIRALEVYYTTGENISSWWEKQPVDIFSTGTLPDREIIKIALMRPRQDLYRRIEARVEDMMQKGFKEEVKGLLKKGYHPGVKPLQSLGYSQMIRHLSGRISLDQAVMEIKKETRRYAKRQLTWFRAIPGIRWYHPEYFRAYSKRSKG